VLLFGDFLSLFGLNYFSTVLQFLPISRDWVMLLFVIPFLRLIWEYFQQTVPTYENLFVQHVVLPKFLHEKRGWCVFCDFLSLRLVLRYFSTVLPNFYLWSRVSDMLLVCDFFSFVFGLKVLQQSYLFDIRSLVLLNCVQHTHIANSSHHRTYVHAYTDTIFNSVAS
jgi:hypothetical protein